MKHILAFLFFVALAGSALGTAKCKTFEYVNPQHYDNSTFKLVGPNLILNHHNELVLTDPRIVQSDNMSLIQGVSYSYYGEPICIAVIDCGAAGDGSVEASVLNVQSGITFTNITLSEICSNPGVFFGCVDTAYFAPNSTETVPPDVVVGEFGDELRVQYTSSRPISGQIRSFSYSIWLSCKEHEFWDYELISTLMIEDSLQRNIRKLELLKEKISALQGLLFQNSQRQCEAIGTNEDLAPAALRSFEFLDCIVDRYTDARQFLTQVSEVIVPG